MFVFSPEVELFTSTMGDLDLGSADQPKKCVFTINIEWITRVMYNNPSDKANEQLWMDIT